MATIIVTAGFGGTNETDDFLTLEEAFALSRDTPEADVIRFAEGIAQVSAPLNFFIEGSVVIEGDRDGDGVPDVTLVPTTENAGIRFQGVEQEGVAPSLVLRDIVLDGFARERTGTLPDGENGERGNLQSLFNGKTGQGGASGAVFSNTTTLTLDGVTISNSGFDASGLIAGAGGDGADGGNGGPGANGISPSLTTQGSIDGTDGRNGGDGGNGGRGGSQGDWTMFENSGSLTLANVVIDETNEVLGARGGDGGDGADGGDGGKGGDGAGSFGAGGDGGDGGDAGDGGDGGDGGNGGRAILGVRDVGTGTTSLIGDLAIAGSATGGGGGSAGAVGTWGAPGAGGSGAFNVFNSGDSGAGGTAGARGEAGTPGGQAVSIVGLLSSTEALRRPDADFLVYVRASAKEVEEGQSVTFSIISAQGYSSFTVGWSIAGEGITEDDILGPTSGTVTFASASPYERQAVTVELAQDALVEQGETLTFTLGDPNTTSDVAAGVGTRSVSVAVLDPPEPPTGGEGGGGDGPGEGDGNGAEQPDPSPSPSPEPEPEPGPEPDDGEGDGDGGSAFPPGALVGTDGPNRLRGDQVEGDAIFGLGGNDRLLGRGGDDQVDGGDEDDLLLGGPGEDTLDGGGGEDSLAGGSGDDTLTGGEGHDYFALVQGELDGIDTVTDFQDGDRIAVDDRLVGLGSGRVEVRDMTFADALVILDLNIFGLNIGDEDTTIFYDADGLGGPGGFAPVMVLEGVTERLAIDDFALF